jgi:GTP-binding protein Era
LEHKAGFVNIIGSPNMGKSTLMNAWLGEKLSIVTHKAQTTRHRILGIYNDPDHQIVFSDTPGILEAKYQLQEKMLEFVFQALTDADVLVWVTDVFEKDIRNEEILEKVNKLPIPKLVLVNKIDLCEPEKLNEIVEMWAKRIPEAQILPISALHNMYHDLAFQKVKQWLPVSPPYYEKDALSNRNIRFFVEELIREKIFLYLDKEIPYCSQCLVNEYKEEGRLHRISAYIIVERESQKAIILGREGKTIKRIGTEAREDIEKFVSAKVFLNLSVKVDKDWRNKDLKLKKYGY